MNTEIQELTHTQRAALLPWVLIARKPCGCIVGRNPVSLEDEVRMRRFLEEWYEKHYSEEVLFERVPNGEGSFLTRAKCEHPASTRRAPKQMSMFD